MDDLIILFDLIISALLVLLLLWSIVFFTSLSDSKEYIKSHYYNENIVHIKIRDIKHIYKVNPNRWRIDETWYPDTKVLIYETDQEINGTMRDLAIWPNTFFYFWLTHQYKRNKKRKKKQLNNQSMVVLLETCQKDIDKMREEAHAYFKDAQKTMQQINKNLDEDAH